MSTRSIYSRSLRIGTFLVLPFLAVAAPEAAPADLTLEAMRVQAGIFPVDAADAAPFLPPGFEAVPFADASPNGPSGLPPLPGEDATVQFLGVSLTWPGNPEGSGAPVEMAIAWLYADPPDDYEDPDRGPWPGSEAPYPYMVVPRLVVTSADLADVLNEMGLPAFVGAVTNDLGSGVGTLHVDDGDAAWTVTTSAPGPAEVGDPEFLRFFGAEGGVLEGIVDFDETAHAHTPPGTALFALEGGTPEFPPPTAGGVAIHSEGGHTLTLTALPEPRAALSLGAGGMVLALLGCRAAPCRRRAGRALSRAARR